MSIKHRKRIFAADDEDFEFSDEGFDFEDPGDAEEGDIGDKLDSISDDIEDMQDDIDDVEEDEVSIETDNNISGHYIAECERCHGIFISAVIESDQSIESINGICPLCEKESEQVLKWVIHDVQQ